MWLPIPDHVAALLGRFTFYAAWLDDVLGEAVVLSNAALTEDSASTPGWASSGKQLVAAVRRIRNDSFTNRLADRLESLNGVRNQLVHGVWLYQSDSVLVMKRSLTKGPRRTAYLTYTYAEIEALIDDYRHFGTIADRLVKILMEANGRAAELDDLSPPSCPSDSVKMEGVIQGEEIVWRCPTCGNVQPLAE